MSSNAESIMSQPANPTNVEKLARDLCATLKGHWYGNYGMARCPAHDDSTPSLSIEIGERAVLFKCWAKCDRKDIARAIA